MTPPTDPAVKKAIHAPDKVWVESVNYLFGGGTAGDPSKWSESDLSKLSNRPADTPFRSRVCLALDETFPFPALKLDYLGPWYFWTNSLRMPQPVTFP